MGFTSLVPDFLSLGHWENKGEFNKFTENYGLKQTQKLLSRFTQYQTWTMLGFLPNLGPDYMNRAGPVSLAGVSLPGSWHVC